MRSGSKVRLGDNAGEEFRVVCLSHGIAWITPISPKSAMNDMLVLQGRLREVGSVYPSFGLRRHGSDL